MYPCNQYCEDIINNIQDNYFPKATIKTVLSLTNQKMYLKFWDKTKNIFNTYSKTTNRYRLFLLKNQTTITLAITKEN